MTYRDDRDLRPSFWQRELFKLKIFGPIVLVVIFVLIAVEQLAE